MKRRRGNCYVTSEALWHLLGGRRSWWRPAVMRVDGDTHWFLVHETLSGVVLDPTAKQFKNPPYYRLARKTAFMTRKPSKRAKKLMKEMLWQ